MVKTENFDRVEVSSARELREWLDANHSQKESIWLVTFKKHVGDKYVSTSEVLDELLSYGWIDGVRRKSDKDRTMQLISPRKAQHWAKTYMERAARLENEGRMRPAGLRAIAESKRNGLWHFLDDVDALIKPGDLVEALAAHPPAAEYFDTFPASAKRFTLRWIKLAKTPETRSRRIEKTAALAARNEKIPGI